VELIDVHVHCGRLLQDRPYLTPASLVDHLDGHGIDRACLLAVENPEELDYYFTTVQVLEACAHFPDRLIPFCCLDPRHRYPANFNPRPIMEEYVELGCRGFGELLAGVPIDHPGLQQIYAVCGELKLPVLFHADHLICSDETGAPRLERMLQTFPQTIFIGHGTRFWAEISQHADLDPLRLANYPSGPVVPTGPTDRLLGQYANLYGDLSARSGYTALTRDPTFGLQFLERYQDKLLFGTDLFYPDQSLPIVEFIRSCPISETARKKICCTNVERLLSLDL
jgi:predicted TIM-barrel fold metal-dependent hydrolase